jgi:hypothetical protein
MKIMMVAATIMIFITDVMITEMFVSQGVS